MSDWAEQCARGLVARWEHGDEAHRQWLRDVAVPDIADALRKTADWASKAAVIVETFKDKS